MMFVFTAAAIVFVVLPALAVLGLSSAMRRQGRLHDEWQRHLEKTMSPSRSEVITRAPLIPWAAGNSSPGIRDYRWSEPSAAE